MIIFLFGALGFSRFPAFKSFEEISGSNDEFVTWSIGIFVANFIFLLRYSRPSYIWLSRALLPTFMSLVVLTGIAFLTLAAVLPSPPSVAKCVQMTNDRKDGSASCQRSVAPNNLRILFIAEGGVLSLLLIAGLWKTDEASLSNLGEVLRDVRGTRRRLCRGEITEPDQASELREPLKRSLEKITDIVEGIKHEKAYGGASRFQGLLDACNYILKEVVAHPDLEFFLSENYRSETDLRNQFNIIAEFK